MAAPTFTPQATVFHPTASSAATTVQATSPSGKPIVNVSANSNAFAPPARLGSGILAATGTSSTIAAKSSPQQQQNMFQKADPILPSDRSKAMVSGTGEKVVDDGQEEEQKAEEAVAAAQQTQVNASVVAADNDEEVANGQED